MEVYYLPGRTGSIETSFIADCILELGFEVVGRNINDQDFLKQLQIIEHDINSFPSRPIICNSYGCYLLLQTLIEMKVTPQMPLCLFSPVFGTGFATGEPGIFYSVSPPRANHIHQAIQNRSLTFSPSTSQIHLGEKDQQFVQQFGGATINIVKNAGHTFSGDYIREALKSFLFV